MEEYAETKRQTMLADGRTPTSFKNKDMAGLLISFEYHRQACHSRRGGYTMILKDCNRHGKPAGLCSVTVGDSELQGGL